MPSPALFSLGGGQLGIVLAILSFDFSIKQSLCLFMYLTCPVKGRSLVVSKWLGYVASPWFAMWKKPFFLLCESTPRSEFSQRYSPSTVHACHDLGRPVMVLG